MKTTPRLLIALLVMASSSQAALLFTFQEIGNDVRITTSGSIMLLQSDWSGDHGGDNYSGLDLDGVWSFDDSEVEWYQGDQLYLDEIANANTLASTFSGDFVGVFSDILYQPGVNDNASIHGLFAPNMSLLFEDTDFVSLGLDAHNVNTNIPVIQFDTSGVDGQVQYRFTPVPEPASLVLLGLGCLGATLRRSRY